MVNPGSFPDAQRSWINEQKDSYAEARREGTGDDYMKFFLRRFFVRFPADRPAGYEPTTEELVAGNEEETMPELQIPSPIPGESCKAFQVRMDQYTESAKALIYRMAVSDFQMSKKQALMAQCSKCTGDFFTFTAPIRWTLLLKRVTFLLFSP